MKTNGVPKIRFKGFTDDWEQRKLGELLNETRNKTTVEDEDTLLSCAIDGMFLNSELFSHFRGSSNIGYLKVKKNDLILSAQNLHLGNCNVNLRFEHGIISPAYKVYELIECNPLFMQAWVKQDKTKDFFLKASTEGASVCRKNIIWEELYKQKLPVPKVIEQQKIGEYFSNLDNLITLHQRKCEQTKELKKFMLQKMFPKKGEKNPEIRFPGFTDDWEQRKFGEMFARRMERNNGEFDNTKWISVARMYYQTPDKVTSNNIDTRTYVMRKGDIAFEGHSNSEFKYGRFVANDIGDGVISELFPIYKHIDKYDLNYWKYAIQLESLMQSKLVKCIEISYTSSNKLDKDSFLKEKIPVASLAEQEKIGEYFSNLDRLITLHQRKCEQLKELKKFMLQNMFPKKG